MQASEKGFEIHFKLHLWKTMLIFMSKNSLAFLKRTTPTNLIKSKFTKQTSNWCPKPQALYQKSEEKENLKCVTQLKKNPSFEWLNPYDEVMNSKRKENPLRMKEEEKKKANRKFAQYVDPDGAAQHQPSKKRQSIKAHKTPTYKAPYLDLIRQSDFPPLLDCWVLGWDRYGWTI